MSTRKLQQQRIYLQAPSENGSTLLIGLQDLNGNNNTQPEVCILTAGVDGELVPGQEVYVLTEGEMETMLNDDQSNFKIVGKKASTDEELTSLAWLQDTNLLQNINLTTPTVAAADSDLANKIVIGTMEKKKPINVIKQDVPAGDSDETESSWDETSNPSSQSDPIHMQHQLVHCNETPVVEQMANKVATKPPHSFSALIFLAIESSAAKALPVRDIYAWITQHFPYYRQAPVGWKNSVRHNLSLNKCFYKVECGLNMSKGSFWMVDPVHRPQLIQSLCKVSYIKADLIHQIVKDAGLPAAAMPAVSSPTPIKSELVAAPKAKETVPVAKTPKTVSTTTSPSSSSTCSSASSSSTTRSNLPDPKLFPFLSRRLAFNGSSTAVEGPDVDAATAMLALGQSPTVIQHLQPDTSNGSYAQSSRPDEEKRRSSWSPGSHSTSSPADDHTYSFNSTRPVISSSIPKKTNNQQSSVSPKRPFLQHEIAQQVPDMVRELEVHTYVLPQESTPKPAKTMKMVRTRGGRSRGGTNRSARGKSRRTR